MTREEFKERTRYAKIRPLIPAGRGPALAWAVLPVSTRARTQVPLEQWGRHAATILSGQSVGPPFSEGCSIPTGPYTA